MDPVRRVDGVIALLKPNILVRRVRTIELEGFEEERWLNRRLPSIIAVMKVAKMTPKGM